MDVVNETELIRLAGEIQKRQNINLEYNELLQQFQELVNYPDVGNLFHLGHSAFYIVKRAISHQNVKPGDLSKKDLIALVEKIRNFDQQVYLLDAYIEMLKNSVSDPNVLNYVFNEEEELSAETIVEKALSYHDYKGDFGDFIFPH